ncbi:iron donor protein CyaY [Biformimicrobium ophioploci]|uniref:Iron-sulfur cluster assembly protein CyaY n=1 Tax=Biformimicrobium ophioploci TaxID=3036711 RepID=A0ABQ6LV32_9GAMM|nr:iron donor protein CyaY [Microbulbifer sp. NKW57]GMG85945.1 iron donor protein CyaY [Microbulbifer sp. NKW57]
MANASLAFEERIEHTLSAVEEAIDDSGLDIDYERSASVLTLELEENGTQVILSRQSGAQELWVAARSGGYHLAMDGDGWLCRKTGEALPVLLDRVLTEQSSEPVTLSL